MHVVSGVFLSSLFYREDTYVDLQTQIKEVCLFQREVPRGRHGKRGLWKIPSVLPDSTPTTLFPSGPLGQWSGTGSVDPSWAEVVGSTTLFGPEVLYFRLLCYKIITNSVNKGVNCCYYLSKCRHSK